MKIKKFHAKTFSVVLKMVKKELGPDAVILSSEQLNENMVEVVAAVDYEGINLSEPSCAAEKTTDLSELKSEVERLKEALVQMKKSGYEMKLPDKKLRVLKLLLKRSVKEEFALRLCEKAGNTESLLNVLTEEIKTMDALSAKKAVMLIGPTGVGKTSTLAKLASQAIRSGKKIAIITLDTYRIGAVEQLRFFARILGVPLEVVSDISDLKDKVTKHTGRDMIFIDTTGRNPRDEKYIDEIRKIHTLGLPIETHLIMSTSSDDVFMIDAYKYYRQLNIDCLGFTKVDEAVNAGSIYNLSVLYQKPVAYITTGQRIPMDIEFPDNNTLARLILEKGVEK
ncbi:flagellar biosynthesis protein FlhF [bacterium BMS3Bbin07]|nr:flagellar biosynthesis protein FlhF [bacterium BMS3Bbin07]